MCDPFSLPSLFFRLDQKYIEVQPLDYIAFNLAGECKLTISTTSSDFWTFGSMALNNFYTVFKHIEGTVTILPVMVDGQQMKSSVAESNVWNVMTNKYCDGCVLDGNE